LMRKDGWTGWKAQGPALLAHCPFYRLGYLPARTHGWDATMAEYDPQGGGYEYGHHGGHPAPFSPRPGGAFVRAGRNRRPPVNRSGGAGWDALKARAPGNDLVYVNEFFAGYRGGVVAAGIHRYAPNLRAGDLAAGAEVYENVASGGSPALRAKLAGRPGVVV